QNFFTLLKLIAIFSFIFAGFLIGRKWNFNFSEFFQMVEFNTSFISAFGFALFSIYWTYDGWYSVNCTASEIKNRRKNLPLSLIFGMLIIILIYSSLNFLYLYALPISEIAGVRRVAEASAYAFFGSRGAKVVSAIIAISIFGCLSSTIIYGPRLF
ncbi:MAG: amino acid permease, partial [Candidatus Aminicenantia bacterium]